MTHDAAWYLKQYHLRWGSLVYDGPGCSRPAADHAFSVPGFVDDLIEKLHIERKLEKLTSWQRKIAKMRIEGYDYQSIADEYDCSRESVNQALVKARKRLSGPGLTIEELRQ